MCIFFCFITNLAIVRYSHHSVKKNSYKVFYSIIDLYLPQVKQTSNIGVTGFLPTLSSKPLPRAKSMCWNKKSLNVDPAGMLSDVLDNELVILFPEPDEALASGLFDL